jgi:nucleotide-binding universal stress UspA family protein
MRWVVGMDLRPLSRGALRFCRWLAGASRAEGGESLHAVHVLEEDHLLMALRLHHLDEVTAAARDAAARTLEAEGLTALAGEPRIVQAATAEAGLGAVTAELGADALVVGRVAPSEGLSLVRLGRVARHLVRAPPTTVVVVPPDLGPAALGTGPVVALSGLGEGSVATCRFAAAVAARLGRDWLLAHVIPMPEDYGAHYLPPASVDEIRKARHREADEAARAFVAAHGLRPAGVVLLEGQPADRAAALAVERGSPLLVAGASHASRLEEAIFRSTAMELAAGAPLPVAFVPDAPAA